MAGIETRLAALQAALERRKVAQKVPIDPLSAALMEYERQLRSFADDDAERLAGELVEDGQLVLTVEEARQMIRAAAAGREA